MFQSALDMLSREEVAGPEEAEAAYKRLQELLMEQQLGTERALSKAIESIGPHEASLAVWSEPTLLRCTKAVLLILKSLPEENGLSAMGVSLQAEMDMKGKAGAEQVRLLR